MSRLLRHAPILPLLLALAACGGGGGGPVAGPQNLGVLASTVPTSVPQTFVNPLDAPATVTQVATTGPFAIAPSALPAQVDPGATLDLELVFTPAAAGVAVGSVTLAYTADGASTEVTYTFQATAESVIWSVQTPTLDFGLVEVGQSLDLLAQFRNGSAVSPVTLTSAALPSSQFSVVGTPFPITLDPGEAAGLTLRYAPASSGTHDGTALVGPLDPGGPVSISILAAAPGGGQEDVTDYGAQAFFGAFSSSLSVTLPADAISLTIECTAGPGSSFGLGELVGPGGKIYENTASTGAYIWVPGTEAFSTTLPNTDKPGVQLVPGGGTYTFRVRRFSGSGTAQVRAIVERRPGGVTTGGVLPLNVYLANGLSVTAASAPSDTRLQAILARLEAILVVQGITLGDVDYYDVTDPAYDNVTEAEFGAMLKLTSGAAEARLNLFFVQQAIGGGVVGVSATLAGPKVNGTSVSGVMSVYGGFSTSTVGLIAAHEIGHFLGLYHTVEETGAHDFIDDTAECPVSGTNAACGVTGGGYLMHWQAVGGTDITDGQALVIRGHPLMEPTTGVGGSVKPAYAGAPAPDAAEDDAWRLPPGWCGTCRNRLESR